MDCNCKFLDDDTCTYFDYASGKSEDGYCLHGAAEFDEDMDAYTGETIECDTYTDKDEDED